MPSDIARFSNRAEIKRSAVWATGIAAPLCLFGASASMALAHSGGLFLLVFAPVLPVFILFGSGGVFGQAPDWLFITLAVVSQFVGTFVVVHILRFAFRSNPGSDG